jgi:DNA-binding LytR/AlgR family response regulator
MAYTCIIVEDESILASIIENYLENFNEIELLGKFEDPISAMRFLNTNTVDLIFLDIQMPMLNGIDFAKTVSSNTSIIFTTAYSEYAIQGFELNALDYLLKPVKFERFVKAINRFFEAKLKSNTDNKTTKTRPHIIIKSEGAFHKITTSDLIYVESLSEYLRYHTLSDKLMVYGTLANVAKDLKPDGFIRIHKSFVVSKQHILSISGNQVFLTKDIRLPIGRTFKTEVLDIFK